MSTEPVPRTAVGEVVLAARDIAKSYGSIRALKGVNFDIHRGQVTTLFGENGAGKSTLMKILSGVVQPTSGDIILDGRPVSFASSTEAREHGISIIHQSSASRPISRCATTSSWAARSAPPPASISPRRSASQTRALMAELEEEIDPLTPVEDLRLGQQQIVEIARRSRSTAASSSWTSRPRRSAPRRSRCCSR